MKKLLYLIIFIPLIFSSCKKEEGVYIQSNTTSTSTNNTSSEIIGSWDLTEANFISWDGYYDGGYPNGTKIITSYQNEISLPGDTSFWSIQSVNWNFKSDGNFDETAVYQDTTTFRTHIWVENGNTLTIDTNNIWSIITLSSSKLTININREDTMTDHWETNNDTVYFYENSSTFAWDRSSFTTDNSTSKRIQSNKDSFFKTFIDRRKR